MISINPVVLCGGFGKRLWPVSRRDHPKQFTHFPDKKTLFQETLLRLKGLSDEIITKRYIFIANERHRFLLKNQADELGFKDSSLLIEPQGKNTAPALTLAALEALSFCNQDTVLVVMPSDHAILNNKLFLSSINQAIKLAVKGNIVTLGIIANSPDINYGYIQTENSPGNLNEYKVLAFHEKPSLEDANTYLSSHFFWNSGIFILKASLWIEAISKIRPDIYDMVFQAWESRTIDSNFIRPDPDLYEKIPADSIDYAVIEKANDFKIPIKMVGLNAGWSDLGSWNSVWNFSNKDSNHNVKIGDVITKESSNSLIYSNSRLVATIGIDNLIVIETPDAILIADKRQDYKIKDFVADLEDKKRKESALHLKVYRPWGWYMVVEESENFKVKRIQVNPMSSLSLQLHKFRTEHWVVVNGIASIQIEDENFLLNENESTYISCGSKHRLSNNTNDILDIIEIQSGKYLGEDDIIRFEDSFGRCD
jgi:mannose-1-phosphate guanylyltransferase/mannose-6-phosphate isomerase